jgi:hypothetical protein
MSKVDHVQRWGADLHAIFEKEEGQENPRRLLLKGIAGGVSWPSAESPGYCCIIGQSPAFSKTKKRIHLLEEFETDSLDEFTEKISDASQRLQCSEFFDSLAESAGGSLAGFRRYIDEYITRRGGGIQLYHNAAVTWQVGVRVAAEYERDGALKKIPGQSILGKQLGQMTKEHMFDGMRPGFYAVNAFKDVLVELDWNPRGGGVDMTQKPPDFGAWT